MEHSGEKINTLLTIQNPTQLWGFLIKDSMTKTQTNKKIVESFLNVKFKNYKITIDNREHHQSNGFYLLEKHYYLGKTKVLYQWERPDTFKVAFDYEFFRELEKWVPVRGKKQIYRNWLFTVKFPEFEYKSLLEKKFSFYRWKDGN